jgi:hypothetical protein
MNLRFATANENKTLHAFSHLRVLIFTRDTKIQPHKEVLRAASCLMRLGGVTPRKHIITPVPNCSIPSATRARRKYKTSRLQRM